MSANQTIESSQSDSPVDSFTYIAEIPSLQEIASNQVALAIRYHDHSRRFLDPNDFIDLDCHDQEFHKYDSNVESLITPSVIKEMIKNSVKMIEEELQFWLNHFNHILYGLSRRPFKVCPVDINWCVWLPNGEIDYLKTGMKMLKSEELSEIQKFLIMCVYCMEDEIKKVSLDILSLDYIANTKYMVEGIQFYWIHFLKNTLHEIPIENYASLEAFIAMHLHLYSRFAVEYFWHRIGEDDQFTAVSKWILEDECNTHFECAVLERFISAMSEHQQRRLLDEHSIEILINFSLYSRSNQCALWAWKICKEEMSEDMFAFFIETVLSGMTGNRFQMSPVFIEIWETAYDYQRNYVMQTKSPIIFDILLFGYNTSENSSEFVTRFLQQIPLEDRMKICVEQATKIRNYYFDLSCLNEILNVCLPHPDDKLEFVKSVIDSEGIQVHFFNFMRKGEFKKLNVVLSNYFGEDIESARAFKIKLLESLKFEAFDMVAVGFIYNVDKWQKFGDYIDEIFSNDPLIALKEKKRLINSVITFPQHRYLFYLTVSRDIDETIKIVQMVFADEELKPIKRSFADALGEAIKSQFYWDNCMDEDEMHFHRIANWCLDNDKEIILKFKKQASPDTAFDGFLSRINVLYRMSDLDPDYLEGLLKRMNKYVEWYFANDDRVKSFKLSKLSPCLKMLKISTSSSDGKDAQILDVLLNWFFDGDDKQIRKFRKKH